MTPKKSIPEPQREIFAHYLEDIIDMRHELVLLSKRIDWDKTVSFFGQYYCADNGKPGHPIRLQVGLQLLKHLSALSDEEVVRRWAENPYWQYLCGEVIFQHRVPMDDGTMARFRQRIGEDGARELLKMTVALGKVTEVIAPGSFETVVADTTVMPKAVSYPTDSKLMGKALRELVEAGKAEGVSFRQTYLRELPGLQLRIGRYAHARQFKRMRKLLKKLRGYLGRVWRDVGRQRPIDAQGDALQLAYYQAARVLQQNLDPTHRPRLYSLHEPEVACIAKGKARTPYEFGSKVSVVTTAAEGFVVDCQALPGNPYDGHTLEHAMLRTFLHTDTMPSRALVDRGYQGSDKPLGITVHITGRKQGPNKAHEDQGRRNSIEPVIGHMKNDGLLDRCYLSGLEGDRIHAVLCAVGFNLKKILRKLRELLLGRNPVSSWHEIMREIRRWLAGINHQPEMAG
jgi:IS5 family transposase